MGRASRWRKNKPQEVHLSQEQVQEFLRILRDDLEFLRSLNYKKPSRTEVRLASSILRRLLHEGMYKSGWIFAGLTGQPSINAVDLQAVVGAVDPRYIHYAYAGGAQTDGAHHLGHVLLGIPRADRETEGDEAIIARIQKQINPGSSRLFPLDEFCLSPAVISGQAQVTRVHLVRYVADKLGGVHWDPRRGEWSTPGGSRDRLLDENHLLVGRLPAPLYEVVSIAQAIASSDDTSKFINKVAEIAPENPRAATTLSFREGRIGKYADMTFNSSEESDFKKAR